MVTFADLDDTLFSSRNSLSGELPLEPAALLASGDVVSYCTPQQRLILQMLRHAGEVVPVTARSREAFSRVLVPFEGYAVLSHGAVVLKPDRSIDLEWKETIKGQLKSSRVCLQDLVSEIQKFEPSGILRSWLVKEDEIDAYVVVKGVSATCDRLEALHCELLSEWIVCNPGCQVFRNGRHLVVIPYGISKMAAVKYLMQEMRRYRPNLTFVGIGDSDSDFGFMRLCDYLIIPPASQLRDSLINGWTKTAASSHINIPTES